MWPLKYRNADKAVCKLGCGQVGLTKKQRLKHELEECPYRTISCPAGCPAEGLTPITVHEHLESQCMFKPVRHSVACDMLTVYCGSASVNGSVVTAKQRAP